MDAADLIWNRAALQSGGASPGPGDVVLAKVLAFHGLVMSGGVLDAVERASAEDLAEVSVAFRRLGLESVADLLASVRRDIDSGVLDDADRAEALELAADNNYRAILPSDEALAAAFRRRLDDDPDAFANVLTRRRASLLCWLTALLPSSSIGAESWGAVVGSMVGGADRVRRPAGAPLMRRP